MKGCINFIQRLQKGKASLITGQVKGNGTSSTKQAHILSLHTLSTPRWGQKVKTFFSLKVVMLHIKQIKGNGAKSTTQAHILSLYTPSTPGAWGGIKDQESSHVTYEINGNGAKSTMQEYILSLKTHSTPGVGSIVKTFFY